MSDTPRTDAEIEGCSNGLKHMAHTHLCSRDTVLDTIEFLNELKRERDQLRKELAESQSWVKASMESAAIASATIAMLERERDQLERERDEAKKDVEGFILTNIESGKRWAADIAERDQLKEQHQVAFNMYERCLIVQHQYEAERDQLKDDLAMAEVRHAAVMMHTQSVVDENTQLRKVADELAYCASQLGWTSSDDASVIRKAEIAVKFYNSLPHVIAKGKTK